MTRLGYDVTILEKSNMLYYQEYSPREYELFALHFLLLLLISLPSVSISILFHFIFKFRFLFVSFRFCFAYHFLLPVAFWQESLTEEE